METLKRATLATLLVGATAGLAACQDDDPTAYTVDFRATACVQSVRQCYDLGVPGAKVEILDGDQSLASGTTDENGVVTLRPSGYGPVRIVITSPLVVGGRKETTGTVREGSMTDLSVRADLATDLTSPGSMNLS